MQNATPQRREREMELRRSAAAVLGTNAGAASKTPGPDDSGAFSPLDLPPRTRPHADLERQLVELSRSEQLARAEAREHREAHEAKDRFLAMLSHELRMPLQPVLAAAAVLIRDPRLPADLVEDVRTIQRNVQLEARLIDDLLDLTRIAAGKLVLERSRVNLHGVIARAVEICEPDAMEKRLVLSTRLRATRSWVDGDPARLQQVLWNLLKNAVKFTPPGGEVMVETLDGPGGRLVIRVTDTGAGIATDVLPHIFEPFEQGGHEVTRRFGGLGLGLAISRMLIERHDGTIAAESAGPGKGSTFTVTLGTTEPPNALAPRAGVYAANPTHRLLRILLVEDDPATALVMSKLLKSIGHTVETAGDCAAALAAAKKSADGPFDLLLCDLGLPDGSGLQIVGPVKAVWPGLKGIALTGYGSDEDVQSSRAAGFDAHLTKPITLERLVHEINRLFP